MVASMFCCSRRSPKKVNICLVMARPILRDSDFLFEDEWGFSRISAALEPT